MLLVTFGAGTNSTGLLVGLSERGIRPDIILFADTGGEKPHTYAHIEEMQEWLKSVGFPEITIVKKVDKNGEVLTLYDNLIDKKHLPSVAYGFKQCSQKYKIAPQDKYINSLPAAKALWKSGGRVTKYIGYDFDEEHRIKNYDCDKYKVEFPLFHWEWGRDECIEAIKRAGLKQPRKSSCFFCPNNRHSEIRELDRDYPDLMKQAIALEDNAETNTIVGLGRTFAWKNLIATSDMFDNDFSQDAPCGCYDGD